MKRYRYSGIIAALIVLGLLPLLPWLAPGLPVTHDGPDHVARIANFYASLTEGNIVPRWAGNLNWGYGHPILMFLYPMSSYTASLFHAVGLPLVEATKAVYAAAYLGSIVAMFAWMAAAWGPGAGVVAAVLYGFAPYRFVDMTVRGAIGEDMAFVFPPLVCLAMLRMARSCGGRQWRMAVFDGIGLSAAAAGLMLAHNAVTIMFIPVFVAYWLYLFFTDARRSPVFAAASAGSAALAGGLSAFFWIPAFFEGKYTLRDIVTRGETVTRFVDWTWFIRSPWRFGQGNEFTKEVGPVQWIGFVLALAAVRGMRHKGTSWFVMGAAAILIGSLVLMTPVSRPVWDAVSVMQKFQFPWRFLTVSVFAAAVAGGLGFDRIIGRLKSTRARTAAAGAICVLTVISTAQMWKPLGYTHKPEAYYAGVYNGTTDTGESSPIWSVRFMEHRFAEPVGVIDGEATVSGIVRSSVRHTYTIDAATPARILENTLYFPGWTVRVNGAPVDIQYQDPSYRGLMTFTVPRGTGQKVEVVFGDTKVRGIATILSLASLAAVAAGIGIAAAAKGRKR